MKYRSVGFLNRDFMAFLYRDDVMGLLPIGDWLQGGCRTLMKAMQLWLGDHAKPMQMVFSQEDEHSEHAFVMVGSYCVDGFGIKALDRLGSLWADEIRSLRKPLPNLCLIFRPFDPSKEPPHKTGELPYYADEEAIQMLVSKLDDAFDKDVFLELTKSYVVEFIRVKSEL